jgi:hypothetical protein
MARFPIRESEVARLAKLVAQGLSTSPDDFPAPPVSPERLLEALDGYQAARAEAIAANAEAVMKTAAKVKALKALKDLVKANLRYAENHTRRDPVKLGALGWGAPRPKNPIEPPGEVRELRMLQELPRGVVLGWRKPVDGGPVVVYKVQRRRRATGEWVDVGTCVGREFALSDQETGVELEFRVIAINKAGEGRPSNVARAVL